VIVTKFTHRKHNDCFLVFAGPSKPRGRLKATAAHFGIVGITYGLRLLEFRFTWRKILLLLCRI